MTRPQTREFKCKLLLGDTKQVLQNCPDNTFHCSVTSPPYWDQRDYKTKGQLGQESTPEEYVENLVAICREVKRVLRTDGTFWLNIGDGYCKKTIKSSGIKQKDLLGIPWMVAFALRRDGWYLRSDVIWCLSGGTWVYARTQKGDSPMMIRELIRLNPKTVKLWNGEKWTQLMGISATSRNSNEIELVLRSGERISCTPTHKFPTNRGLLQAGDIKIGDKLKRVRIPEPDTPISFLHITKDAFWFAGLYLAEGSRSEDTIQIAGHIKEVGRWEKLQKIVKDYGGNITRSISGNKMDIRIYGKILNSLIDYLVSGKIAKNKGIAPIAWEYDNKHLEAFFDGYLSGDGSYDEKNKRWRLQFTRNYNLERDLRTICARLNYHLVLNLSFATFNGCKFPSFLGEIRKKRSNHFNEKNTCEIIDIRKARCRNLYDIGVEDEPHLFALASGILTHNSKTNPMPDSATDRLAKSHEHLFLLSKSNKYFFDMQAIKEPQEEISIRRAQSKNSVEKRKDFGDNNYAISGASQDKTYAKMRKKIEAGEKMLRNKRDVWTMPTADNREFRHFAIYPEILVKPCLLAATSSKGCCPKCKAPWVRKKDVSKWEPSCTCKEKDVQECLVLDPFNGSGTTGRVCMDLHRKYVGVDISEEYINATRDYLIEKDFTYTEGDTLADIIE